MNRQTYLRSMMWLGFCVYLGLWHAVPAYADCLELKNDTFDPQQNPQAVAVRSFCISEIFGTIFIAPEDITVQKVRLLISGDGKNIMEQTTLKLSIYKEAATGNADPGENLVKEVEYAPPASINQPTPQWLEIEKVNTVIKKGERFRVVFAHANINCEERAQGKPLCAEVCSWWSATVDKSATKPKTNLAEGSMFQCPELTERKWRFWEDMPASCRPSGNLILRVFAATTSGKDCLGGGVGPGTCTAGATQGCTCNTGASGSQTCTAAGTWGTCSCASTGCTAGATQPCTCGAQSGTQTCTAAGAWGTCSCGSAGACTPGDSKECACTNGQKGAQTCASTGQAWDPCKCEGSASGPVITNVTPDKGPINQNVNIAILGENFDPKARVLIGSIVSGDVRVISNTSISAVVPAAIQAGAYDVVVENPDGKRGTLKKGYTVEAPKDLKGGCGCTTLPHSPSRIPIETFLLLGFALLLLRERRPRTRA